MKFDDWVLGRGSDFLRYERRHEKKKNRIMVRRRNGTIKEGRYKIVTTRHEARVGRWRWKQTRE